MCLYVVRENVGKMLDDFYSISSGRECVPISVGIRDRYRYINLAF